MQYPEGHESIRAATALLSRHDKKRSNKWFEAVQDINFLHCSRVAWSTLNNLTGRWRQSPRQCYITANAIANQLVKNGKYKAAIREISRSIMQELPDLWRATNPDAVNISGCFSSREFAAVFHHLKRGNSPGSDSICSELLTHAGPGLNFWLCGFIFSCLHLLKILKVWERAMVVAIPKLSKPVEDP